MLPSSEGAQKLTAIHKKLAEKLVPQGLKRRLIKDILHYIMVRIEPKIYQKLPLKLGEIACNTKSLTLNFDDNIVVVGPGRWIDINIKRSAANSEVEQNYKAICNLHSKVVDTFYGYHQGPLERATNVPETETFQSQIKAQDEKALKIEKQIQTYGVSGLYELYNPHFTGFLSMAYKQCT
jgi:hypothetical protein